MCVYININININVNVPSVCVCVCVYTNTHIPTRTQEYYSTLKSKEITLFVPTWINLEDIRLSEINQAQKDKYHMISLQYGI